MADQQIITWIREQQRGGYSQGQIYASLLQNGYSAEQAKAVIDYANNSQQLPQAQVQQPRPQSQQPVQQPRQQMPRQQMPRQQMPGQEQVNSGLPSGNIFLAALFSLISFGAYSSSIFGKIIDSSKQEDPSLKTVKELNSLIKFLGIFLIIVTIAFIVLSNMNLTSFLESLNLSGDVMAAIEVGIFTQIYFFTLFFFLAGIYAISIAVMVMLKKNFETTYSTQISGIGILFGALYLQKKINDFNSSKR